MGYTKLFSEIIMSTVWREKDQTRILWITMLALRDRWHTVNASLPGLADAARIPLDKCIEGIKILSDPDPYSRSTDFEGRRIEPCEGGWRILNGEKYRQKMSLDERNEYQRIKQKEYRDKKKNMKRCLQSSQRFTQTETEEETKTDSKEKDLKKKDQNTLVRQKPPDPAQRADPPPDKNIQFKKLAKPVLEYFNEITGRNYDFVDSHLTLIATRIKEAQEVYQSIDDATLLCRRVILDRKRNWESEDDMREYLRPKTVFAKSNFWNYAGGLPENMRISKPKQEPLIDG